MKLKPQGRGGRVQDDTLSCHYDFKLFRHIMNSHKEVKDQELKVANKKRSFDKER